MHGAGRDEKVVMIPDGEEEVDSIREAIVDFGRDSGGRVSTSSPESTMADYILKTPNSKAHSIFDYPWLGPRTTDVWRPWDDPYPIDSTLGGILHAVTAAYLGERQVKRTKTDCRYRVRLHTDRAAGGKILPTCWTGHGRQISLKDLGGDEWDELALFKWNERGLSPRVFCDERTWWGLEDCLKQMGAFDRDVLKFAVERIMKKRVQRKREAKGEDEDEAQSSAFGRLYSSTVIEECRALKGTW